MTEPAAPNWIHLDLKGTIPDEPGLVRWLDRLATAGINGVVFEYEDRYPWQTWPGTFRPGFDRTTWGRIWQRCEQLGLEIVPLIQVQGHLDWLLKHEAYAPLAEAGACNEVCPMHEDVLPAMKAWIDEIAEAHPGRGYLHLGADETWHLASCSRCRAVAEASDDGKLGVYVGHVGALCEHAVDKGLRPIIWADMFLREQRIDLTAAMPVQTILVNWQYFETQPAKTAALAGSGRTVWGGSGVRNIFNPCLAQAPLMPRLGNVLRWRRHLDAGDVSGLIHTNWGRSSSLRPIYGPWEGWLPAMIAAGDAAAWADHPLRDAVPLLDQALDTANPAKLRHLLAELDRYDVTDGEADAQSTLRWWRLALEHRLLVLGVTQSVFGYHTLMRTGRHIGPDAGTLAGQRKTRDQLRDDLGDWQQRARAFWQAHALSDIDEYFDSRVAAPLDVLERDASEHEELALNGG